MVFLTVPLVGVMVTRIFEGLRMDAHNMEQTAAETMCLRDLEVLFVLFFSSCILLLLQTIILHKAGYRM